MMKRLFDEYPCLEDDRVILRKLTEDDAPGLERLTSESAVYRTLPSFLFELKYEDKREAIARMDEEYFDCRESLFLGIFPAEDPAYLIGIAEIYNYEERKKKASIGVRMDENYQGKGIATAVTELLKHYLISRTGLETITAHALTTNKGSETVLLRCGFIKKYPGLYEDWGFDELKLTDKYVFKAVWLGGEPPEGKMPDVKVEKFVMEYQAEHDRIKAMLPEGYVSLRPVFRIITEIRDDGKLYAELNTPVEADGRKGWLNIANWKSTRDDIRFERLPGGEVEISSPFLKLSYKGTGIKGEYPACRDDEGCYYIGNDLEFRPAEKIEADTESCECSFEWRSREEPSALCDKQALSAENAAAIPCGQVLGSYIVRFTRKGRQ